ncbi:type II toxin-antitoxin system VapB family antitoxin [Curtobacterium oceanosedimentum]
MARVSIERELLDEARQITGSKSDREVLVLALETLIAVHRTSS